MLERINPAECGPHSGYTHGVKTVGNLLFIAGQVGWNEQGKITSTDFAEQFDRALANVLAVIREAGGLPKNLARLTMYVLDRKEYVDSLKALGESYRRRIGKHYPAMTLVEVQGLLEENARLEIEATAVL